MYIAVGAGKSSSAEIVYCLTGSIVYYKMTCDCGCLVFDGLMMKLWTLTFITPSLILSKSVSFQDLVISWSNFLYLYLLYASLTTKCYVGSVHILTYFIPMPVPVSLWCCSLNNFTFKTSATLPYDLSYWKFASF